MSQTTPGAKTLDALRGNIVTSVHGRRLGFDVDEFMVGSKGFRHVVTVATSATTGTALPNHGVVAINSSNARTWSITDPEPGCEVKIVSVSSSTLSFTITPAAATFATSGGSTGASAILQGGGTGVVLVGITTGLYAAMSSPGSTYIDLTT